MELPSDKPLSYPYLEAFSSAESLARPTQRHIFCTATRRGDIRAFTRGVLSLKTERTRDGKQSFYLREFPELDGSLQGN